MSKRKKFLIVSLVIIGLVVIGNLSVPQQWQINSSSPNQQQIESLKKFDIETVKSVKQRYVWWLFLIPGVNGVGISSCHANKEQLCIGVDLERETIAARILIPQSLEGIPVEWEMIGKIFAL